MSSTRLLPYLVAIFSIATITAAFIPLRHYIEGKPGTVAFLEIIVVVLIATRWGTGPAITASILGVLSWDYFFLQTHFGLVIGKLENGALLAAVLISSVCVGQLSAQAARRTREAEASRYWSEQLYSDLQRENEERKQAQALLRQAQENLEMRVLERTQELESINERFASEIADRKRIERDLLESRERLRALSAHLEVIREEERKRIALEIHDELGQLLTALKMELSLLRMHFSHDAQTARKIGDIRELTEKTIHVVRNVASQLRPAALNLGIVPALEWLAEECRRHGNVSCKTDIRCGEIALDDTEATTIFRIVQESLTNVMRHASATRVTIGLARHENSLTLQIKDDGKGFDPQAAVQGSSYGLLGIRERTRLIGGSFKIDSIIDQGTTLSIQLPLNEVTTTTAYPGVEPPTLYATSTPPYLDSTSDHLAR